LNYINCSEGNTCVTVTLKPVTSYVTRISSPQLSCASVSCHVYAAFVNPQSRGCVHDLLNLWKQGRNLSVPTKLCIW